MNTKTMRLGVMMMLCGATGLSAIAANSNAIIPFQGAVAVKPGQPPLDSNPLGAKFQIFNAATDGALLFEDIQQIQITNGTFSVELGGGATPLDPNLAQMHPDLWLQITIDVNRNSVYEPAETMTPRIHLGAAPFALHSQSAGRAEVASRAESFQAPVDIFNRDNSKVAEIDNEGVYVPSRNLGTGRDPVRGGLYRDNSCIAWALIGRDGEILSGFGIRDVFFDSDFDDYTIELWNDVEFENGTPAYSVVVTSLDTVQRPELAIYEAVDGDEFRVTIFALDSAEVEFGELFIPRVRSPFSVQVFGRLD